MAGARRFEELVCWQLSYALRTALLEIAERPRVRADHRFYSQLTDAARSAPRTIAEGFGRRTHADFALFLDFARGSLMECQNHLRDAADSRYITIEERDKWTVLARRAGGAVAALQRYLRRQRR